MFYRLEFHNKVKGTPDTHMKMSHSPFIQSDHFRSRVPLLDNILQVLSDLHPFPKIEPRFPLPQAVILIIHPRSDEKDKNRATGANAIMGASSKVLPSVILVMELKE